MRDMRVPNVEVHDSQMQMKRTEHRKQAQGESHEKADQINVGPSHVACLLFLAPGCSTSNNRSARPGVSRIESSSTRHLRDSACLAKCSSAWLTSGSRRNRSAPEISHRSSL